MRTVREVVDGLQHMLPGRTVAGEDVPYDEWQREVLAPIAGRGEEVRERLRVLASMTSRSRVIRHHGNFHLGDLLWTGSDWCVLDFEACRNACIESRDFDGCLQDCHSDEEDCLSSCR